MYYIRAMENFRHIVNACQKLNKNPHIKSTQIPSQIDSKYIRPIHNINNIHDDSKSGQPTDPQQVVSLVDVNNLKHFVQIWTDVLDIDEVNERFDESDYLVDTKSGSSDCRKRFEHDNGLINVGFFYVKVNKKCSVIEFLGLLDKIPFEHLCLPATLQIPYSAMVNIFGKGSEQIVIQLMVLGDFFGYWQLVNPHKNMDNTCENFKLILSATGGLSVIISPNYLKDCVELVKSVELSTLKQSQTNFSVLK
jgi:hypothetical protein